MRVDLRAAAAQDIEAAVAYSRGEGGAQTAIGLVNVLEAAIDHIGRHPLTGSLRFAFEVEIPDLRSWPVDKFPYLIFYVPDADRVEIWRVLHTRRDIPAQLGPVRPA